jgi:hypothetical protein
MALLSVTNSAVTAYFLSSRKFTDFPPTVTRRDRTIYRVRDRRDKGVTTALCHAGCKALRDVTHPFRGVTSNAPCHALRAEK